MIGFESQGGIGLSHFNDTIVTRLALPGESPDGELAAGNWVLTARVVIGNEDDSPQDATAKLVHDADVVLDSLFIRMPRIHYETFYLQAAFTAHEGDIVTLECNTYQGIAYEGSVIALRVDRIIVQ